jgi:DNA-binding MarR family transcriptional regulator
VRQDDSIGFIINQAGRRLSQLLAIRFSAFDVTTEQWSVLSRLCEQDGISQKDLAGRVGKDQTNITRILDQLERKKLAERRANPDDRRSFCAFVTDAGRSLQSRLAPIEVEVLASVTEGLTEQQCTILKQLLIQLTDKTNALLQHHEKTS